MHLVRNNVHQSLHWPYSNQGERQILLGSYFTFKSYRSYNPHFLDRIFRKFFNFSYNKEMYVCIVENWGKFYKQYRWIFSEALILYQLTHNMTTDCSLNFKFNTWKFQAHTWGYHVVYRNCFWHSEQFLYTTCFPHVLQKEELLTKIYLYI